MIEKYVKLRNRVEEIKKQHKDQLAPYVSTMSQLENLLLEHLNTNSLQSINGAGGTAYKQTATSVTVQDWEKTLEYIRANEAWDLLEARVSKTAAIETVEETKKPIPGVVFNQAIVIRVRVT
jgi:hypothetical protein